MNVKNIREAYAFIASIPATDINLGHYWDKNGADDGGPCGCALGHMAKAGMFGLQMNENGVPLLEGNPTVNYSLAGARALDIHQEDASALFSGPYASRFDARNTTARRYEYDFYDSEFFHNTNGDKAMWMNRMEKFMEENGIKLVDHEEPQKLLTLKTASV